ncbi:MAG: hypothetical protein KDC67_17710, partial [Ignavibacteriae bacterium]|nr:hypothetical protein [Ignavibacteriota bacterium]
KITQPSQMPNRRETKTCFVFIAKTIASKGGKSDQKLKCSIEKVLLLKDWIQNKIIIFKNKNNSQLFIK